MTTVERPYPMHPSGIGNSGYAPCCYRCHDSVDPTNYGTTSVQTMTSQWVVLAFHIGECPPSRWCPDCQLIDDHCANCLQVKEARDV